MNRLLNENARALFVVVVSLGVQAQVGPPKHETGAQHVRNSRAQNYSQRFEAIKCALVLVGRAGGSGTGVFISPNGDVATASHVLGDRTFKTASDGSFEAGITMPDTFTITDCHGNVTTVSNSKVEVNGDAWGADLAVIQSGINTPRDWMKLSTDSNVEPGAPLITMGFPGLAWGSLSIYAGIASTDDKVKLDAIAGVTSDTNQGVKATNEFVQLQMPISPGLSGSPVIDEDNRVVAIVTQAGSSTQMVDFLIQLNHAKVFGVPTITSPAPGQQQITNLNAFSILAEFAEHLKNFASPGYGDAVPIRYLKRGSQPHQQPASQSH
jgi:S1-C subfamily serine protease